VRGGTWPGGAPASTTFTGTLRSKPGLALDLPTEAQWEYAWRAATTKARNNNTDLGERRARSAGLQNAPAAARARSSPTSASAWFCLQVSKKSAAPSAD